MKILILPATTCSLLLMAACASEPERGEPPEGYFATYIEDDGTKMFQYTMELPHRTPDRAKRQPGGAGGQLSGSSSGGISGGVTMGSSGRSSRPPPSSSRAGYDRFQQLSTQLENRLEAELARSNFCHEGHQETDRVVEPPTPYIRGRCKESASAEDRQSFPNDT